MEVFPFSLKIEAGRERGGENDSFAQEDVKAGAAADVDRSASCDHEGEEGADVVVVGLPAVLSLDHPLFLCPHDIEKARADHEVGRRSSRRGHERPRAKC